MSGMCLGTEQQFRLRWNRHQANFIEAFEGLLEEEAFTDVTIAVEGVMLKCHKIILAACSEYFKMVFSDVPANCSHPVVVLKDVKLTEMKLILEYVYKGVVNVRPTELASILNVAQMLRIKGLIRIDPDLPPLDVDYPNGRHTEDSPPSTEEMITTTTSPQNLHHYTVSSDNLSPARSTGSQNYGYPASPNQQESSTPRYPWSAWAHTQGVTGHIPEFATRPSYMNYVRSMNPIESELTHHRQRDIRNSSILANPDTPILRGVLGQVHADSSQPAVHHIPPSDGHFRGQTNGSTDGGPDSRRNSQELPLTHLAWSSRRVTEGTLTMNKDEKEILPQSSTATKRSDGVNPVQPPNNRDWKRYKQYTRADIRDALAAVRGGMSALQAARKFGVPSRTLYDKVKKLGILTSRPGRRASISGGASLQHGVGRNESSGIFGHSSRDEAVDNDAITANALATLGISYAESRRDSSNRDASMDQDGSRTPPPENRFQPSPPLKERRHPKSLKDETTIEGGENKIEDLSIPRKAEVTVIMSPSTVIKIEKDTPK